MSKKQLSLPQVKELKALENPARRHAVSLLSAICDAHNDENRMRIAVDGLIYFAAEQIDQETKDLQVKLDAMTAELNKWQTAYYYAEEHLCSCNHNRKHDPDWKEEWTYTCEWHKEHPSPLLDEKVFTLSDQIDALKAVATAAEDYYENGHSQGRYAAVSRALTALKARS